MATDDGLQKPITKETTFRELLDYLEDRPIPKKLPSARRLREEGELIFIMQIDKGELRIYNDGNFLYSSASRETVQCVKRCNQPIWYDFCKVDENDNASIICADTFMDLPFYIRLIYEGEERLVENMNAKERRKVYSYDNVKDSIDLEDPDSDCSIRVIEKIVNEQQKKNLREALTKLTIRQRKVVELYYLQGMTQQQVADKLGCTKQSVNECLKRAKIRIGAYYIDT